LGRVEDIANNSNPTSRNQFKREPLAEIKPATPISKRVRQRARNNPSTLLNQEKTSLLHFAENLRSKLINQNAKPNEMSDSSQSQSQLDAPSSEPSGNSMEVEVKPKMKLFFDDETSLSEVVPAKEEVEAMDTEATLTSPKRKLPAALSEVGSAESQTEQRVTKKRKSTTEFSTPDDDSAHETARKDSLMVRRL
jgi:hypothetical protein